MKRALCLLLMALSFAHFASDTSAQTEPVEISAEERERDARELFSLATRHFETGRFGEAIEEYARAYDLFPLPALQFNLYLAYRDSDNVTQSIRALRLYLETASNLDPERRASLERRLEAIESRSTTDDEGSTSDTTGPEENSGMSPAVGGVILGVGGAMLVGALIEGLVANGKNGELDEVCTAAGCEREAHDSIVSSFETHRNVAWGLLYAGAAVAATGAVLLLLSGKDDSDDEARADLSCDPNGCVGSIHGRF